MVIKRDTLNNYLVFLLVVTSSFQWVPIASTPIGFVSVFDIMSLFIILIFLFDLIHNKFKIVISRRHNTILLLLMVFFALSFISYPFSVDLNSSTNYMLRISLVLLVLLNVLSWSTNNDKIFKYILYGFITSGLLYLVHLFLVVNLEDFIRVILLEGKSFSKAREYGRADIVLNNVNRIGEIILIALTTTMYLKINKQMVVKISNILIILFTVGVVITFSRQALLILILLYFIYFYHVKLNLISMISIFTISFSLALLFINEIILFFNLFIMQNIETISSDENSISERFTNQLIGLKVVGENILGLGIGSMKKYMEIYNTRDTHNFIVNSFIQLGLLGGLYFIILWIYIYSKYLFAKSTGFVLIWIPYFLIGLINLLHLSSFYMWIIISLPFIFKRDNSD